MSMKTHTAGPWDYHLGRGANPRFHIQTTGGYQIASTTELVRHPHAFEENEGREANARLIAAAPDLLEACKHVVAWHREHDSGDGEFFGLDFVTDCISAIRKTEATAK